MDAHGAASAVCTVSAVSAASTVSPVSAASPAPVETMQLRRLIKRSTESLGSYLFGKIEFWNF